MKSFLLTLAAISVAFTLRAQIANDDCVGAIAAGSSAFGNTCTNSISASTAGATPSLPSPGCAGASADDDIWYSFTASSSSMIIRVENALNVTTGFANIAMEVYGGSCATLNSIFCINGFAFASGYRIINGLTIGNTYYIRFWSVNASVDATFDFCIQQVPNAPSNDECNSAVPILTQAYGTACTSSVFVNTTGATHSLPDPSCGILDSNDDLWYSFTANSSSIILRYSNAALTTSGGSGSLGYALYNNSCPVNTSTVSCSNSFGFSNGFQIINGLTIGQTYLLRLFSQSSNNYMSFEFCIQDVPAPPINDECGNAIPIVTQAFGTNCNASVSVNTTGATHSLPDPSCGVQDSNDDLWYSFTANSSSIILRFSNAVLTTFSSNGSLGYALYHNSCPLNTNTVSCSNSFGFNSGFQIINGLTIGQSYLLRLFSQGVNNYMSFEFCIQDVPAPPANDECSNAIPIQIRPFGTQCDASVSVNTTGATHSLPDPSCGVQDSNDDLWYSFTANSASAILRFSNAMLTTSNSLGSLGYVVYEGSCPTASASVVCVNSIGLAEGYQIINGLTPGNSYLLRLFSQGVNNYMRFDFCLQSVPPAPGNNECVNAIPVGLQLPGNNCQSGIAATTAGATPSQHPPSCLTFNSANDDIWYSFTAQASTAVLRYSNCTEITTGNMASLGFALYNSCPTGSTTLACANSFGFSDGFVNLTGLTPGNTYYLRLFGANVNNYVSFNFCIQSPLQNDECSGAISVPVTNGFCTNPVVASLNGATSSAGFGFPSCAISGSSKDVWFTVTIPSTGNVIIQTFAVKRNARDLVMTAFSGGCGSLTEFACDDNGNPDPSPSENHSRLTLTGRTPGEIIYLRVTPLTSASEEQFGIGAWDETISVLPAISSGGNCIDASTVVIDSSQANQYRWVPVFDASNQIVATIFANGNELGEVNFQLFVNNGPVRQLGNKYYLDRNISITSSNTLQSPARLRIYYKQSELSALQAVDATISGPGNLKAIRTNTDCEAALSGTASSITQENSGLYGSHHYLQFSTPGFSSFYMDGLSGSLPLRFISFSAQNRNRTVALQWVVEKDPGITHFEIQKSNNGVAFTTIAKIPQQDLLKEQNGSWIYQWTDASVLAKDSYYRILLLGENNQSLYSSIVAVQSLSPGSNTLMIYPNPASEKIAVQLRETMNGYVNFSLQDVTGKIVRSSKELAVNGLLYVQLGALAPGVYSLTVETTKGRSGSRLIRR